MTNDDGTLILIQDPEIRGITLRTFLYLTTQSNFENTVHTSQPEISKILGSHKSNITRAIQILERKGMIARLQNAQRHYWFMINPYFVWKGRAEHIPAAERKFATLRREVIAFPGTKRETKAS